MCHYKFCFSVSQMGCENKAMSCVAPTDQQSSWWLVARFGHFNILSQALGFLRASLGQNKPLFSHCDIFASMKYKILVYCKGNINLCCSVFHSWSLTRMFIVSKQMSPQFIAEQFVQTSGINLKALNQCYAMFYKFFNVERRLLFLNYEQLKQ